MDPHDLKQKFERMGARLRVRSYPVDATWAEQMGIARAQA